MEELDFKGLKGKLPDFSGLKGELPYKWKVQTAGEYSAIIVSYIDARILMDQLDKFIGPENWSTEYKLVGQNLMCGLSIYTGDKWVQKWDVGIPSQYDSEKGQVSDAFKRAGVQWGVARFLYDIETVNLSTIEKMKGQKKIYVPAHNPSAVNIPLASIPRGIMVKGKIDGKWITTTEIKNVNKYMNEVYLPYKKSK